MDEYKIISRFGVNNGRLSILHNLRTLSTFDSNYENALSLIHDCKSYYGLFHPSSLDMRMDIKHAHIWVVYHFYSQSSQGYNLIAIDKRFGNQSSIIEPFDLYLSLMKIK